jgi:hypothetical protein
MPPLDTFRPWRQTRHFPWEGVRPREESEASRLYGDTCPDVPGYTGVFHVPCEGGTLWEQL